MGPACNSDKQATDKTSAHDLNVESEVLSEPRGAASQYLFEETGELFTLLQNNNNNNQANKNNNNPQANNNDSNKNDNKDQASNNDSNKNQANNNNNNNNQANTKPEQIVIPTIQTLELQGNPLDLQEVVEDAPLLLALLLNNNNNNPANVPGDGELHLDGKYHPKKEPEQIVIPTIQTLELQVEPSKLKLRSASSDDSEDCLTMTQIRNWNTKKLLHQLSVDKPKQKMDSAHDLTASQEIIEEAPIVLALLLNNQNNNPENIPGDKKLHNGLIPPFMLPKYQTMELRDGSSASQEVVEEAPLLLALPLNNQNYTPENIPGDKKLHNGLIPEHLVIPTLQTMELKNEALTLKLRGAARENFPKDPLTMTEVHQWKENGYLVIPNALSTHELASITSYVEDHVQKVFSPHENVKVHSFSPGQSTYASPCGRAMVTLTELNAQNSQSSKLSPMQRVQRIGCGAHLHFPPVRRAVHSRQNASLARSLGFKDPRIVECTILAKAARTGRKIGSHQDGGSLYTGDDMSGVTFWYALHDSSIENGCLEVARGTHRTEPIYIRTVLDESGQCCNADLEKPVRAANFDDLDPSTLPVKNDAGQYEFTKLPVQAGTLIMMHGNLLHTSAANSSDSNRMAMKFAIVEGQHGWPEDNFMQPGREGGFESLRGLY